MKTRLLGAAVLFALAVLFLPMIFNGKSSAPSGDQTVGLAIPPAQDRQLQTRTMSLNPDAPVTTPNAAAASTAATPVSAASAAVTVSHATGDALATVNIGSSRPWDVETDPAAGKAPTPTTVTVGSGASPSQPVIPMASTNKPAMSMPAANTAATGKAPSSSAPTRTALAETANAAATGHGSYTLNLSAYASAAGAASLERRVRALGYPVAGHPISQAGKARTLVIAGPFDTRAGAEAARLKITQSIPGAPARVEQDASHAGEVAATASVAPERAGGWAVQVAAMSSQADANVLRDQLRNAGFDGYVDSAVVGGKTLWRVRAGPQTQRADAQRVLGQIKAKLGKDGNVVSVH